MNWLGFAAVLFFLLHVAYHSQYGDVSNSLWACHMASLLIGCGALTRIRQLTAIGVLWLVVGIPLWFYYLATGGDFYPTSVLTHGGGMAVGLIVLKKQGMPKGVWWQGVLGIVVLTVLTRWLTEPALNVNLAFHIPSRPSATGADHARYLVSFAVGIAIVFFVSEAVLQKIFVRRTSVVD